MASSRRLICLFALSLALLMLAVGCAEEEPRPVEAPTETPADATADNSGDPPDSEESAPESDAEGGSNAEIGSDTEGGSDASEQTPDPTATSDAVVETDGGEIVSFSANIPEFMRGELSIAEPDEDVPPDPWLSWSIRFEMEPDGFGNFNPRVRKEISFWYVYDRLDGESLWYRKWNVQVYLDCEAMVGMDPQGDYREFFQGSEPYVTFKTNQHIACTDVNLLTVINRVTQLFPGILDEEPLNFASRDGVACFNQPGFTTQADCMWTSSLLVRADTMVAGSGPDPTPFGLYPILEYPHLITEVGETGPTIFLGALNGENEQQILFRVFGFNSATAEIYEEARGTYRIQGFHTIQVRRYDRGLGLEAVDFVEFIVDDVVHYFTQLADPLSELRHQFPVERVEFYLGDRQGLIPAGGDLRLGDLIFDPNDSCGGCLG